MTPIERVLAHRDFVRRLARRLVGDSHAADDVAQQTLLIGLRSAPDSEHAARSWLARVVRNVVISRRMAEAARRDRERAHESRTTTPAPHVELASAETSAALLEALSGLDPLYRDVLRLRFYEGLSPSETAERLGVGVETVRTRQKRGLQRMRDAMERLHVWGLSLWLLMLRRRARPIALSAGMIVALTVALLWLGSSSRDPTKFDGMSAGVAARGPDAVERLDRASAEEATPGRRRELPALVADSALRGEADAPQAVADALVVQVSVIRPDGAPAAGAQVWIQRPDHDCAENAGECDADGRTSLADVPAGSWIGASLEPFRESLLWRLDSPQFGLTSEKLVRLELGEPLAVLAIRVVDGAGQPLPEANVRIVPDRRPLTVDLDRFLAHRERRIAPGEHDGVVQALGLRPYMWVIHASAPGYADACLRRHLRVGHAPTEAVLTLRPGRSLSGRLRLLDGRPASGALVRVDPGFPFAVRTVRADEFGDYEIEQLPDAALTLEAFTAVDGEGFTARATAEAGIEAWDASLERGGRLVGEARWNDGAAIANAQLLLLRGDERRVVQADEWGSFVFDGCPPPPFDVALAHPNSRAGYSFVASVSDDTTPLRLMASRTPTRLAGSLRVDERNGPRPLTLWLCSLDWNEEREIPLEPSTGRFEVEAAPGRFEILVWEYGYSDRFKMATLDLEPGTTARVDLQFESRGTLEVAGLDPELRKGRVVLAYPDGRVAAWKTAAAGGTDVLATFAAPQGRYALRYESDQMVQELDDLCITAGVVERVELRVGSRRRVLGALQLPDPFEVAGARPWVAIDDLNGRRHFLSSFEPRARFDFEALLNDGEYVLTARVGTREWTHEFVVDGPARFLSISLDE